MQIIVDDGRNCIYRVMKFHTPLKNLFILAHINTNIHIKCINTLDFVMPYTFHPNYVSLILDAEHKHTYTNNVETDMQDAH